MIFIRNNEVSRVFKSALLAVLALSFFAARASAQTTTFSARDYAVVANGHIAADFNGDGKVDLAAAGLQLLVMLNNGDGTFGAPTSYPAGNGPQDLAAGDFNGDGKVDLVVTNNDSQVSLNVLLGNGDGTFGAAISSPNVTGLESPSVVAGDFDRDGVLDVAVAHPSGCYSTSCVAGRSISLLRGNGDGTFQPSQQMDVGLGPVKLVVGDFNRDTISDLGVAAASAKVFILLGRGDGTFAQQPDLTLVNDPFADNTDIDAGDFNRDGVQDLAVSSPSQGSRTFILLGVGDGTFGPPSVITDPDQQQPQHQAVADFNGDGIQDIALGLGVCCTTSADGFMNILFGNGDGTFQPAAHYLAPNAVTGNSGGVLVASDFNGDGKTDIAMQITGASPRLTVLTNSTGVAPAPVALGSITATPSSVGGGASATFNVSLSQGAVAPSGGLKLSVSSSNSSVVSVPSSVTFPAGASSVQFKGSTSRVASTQTITITVTNKQYGKRSTTVTVTTPTPPPPPPAGAPTVLSLALNPATVTGGSAAQGTVTLSASVSAATVVSLASSNAAATVPASVTVAAGSSSATFTVGTTSVSASASATISATLNGTTRGATLTINPAAATTTDTVAISLAQYDPSKRVVRIEATSTRSTATLQVFVTASGELLGTLTNNGGGKYGGEIASPTNPQSITVRSNLGGSATRAVVSK
jgi:hypothetical protein